MGKVEKVPPPTRSLDFARDDTPTKKAGPSGPAFVNSMKSDYWMLTQIFAFASSVLNGFNARTVYSMRFPAAAGRAPSDS